MHRVFTDCKSVKISYLLLSTSILQLPLFQAFFDRFECFLFLCSVSPRTEHQACTKRGIKYCCCALKPNQTRWKAWRFWVTRGCATLARKWRNASDENGWRCQAFFQHVTGRQRSWNFFFCQQKKSFTFSFAISLRINLSYKSDSR